MKMSQVVETVSKKKIPNHVRSLVFEICCDDEKGQDVEVPFVQYRLRPRQWNQWYHLAFGLLKFFRENEALSETSATRKQRVHFDAAILLLLNTTILYKMYWVNDVLINTIRTIIISSRGFYCKWEVVAILNQ